MIACEYCGSRRGVSLYGNPPGHFMVRIGAWARGRYLCARCLAAENRRAVLGKPSPRLAARILRFLRGRRG